MASDQKKESEDVENLLRQGNTPRASSELVQLLLAHKNYWLIPAVLAVLLLGALVFLSGTAAAPFLYTLF